MTVVSTPRASGSIRSESRSIFIVSWQHKCKSAYRRDLGIPPRRFSMSWKRVLPVKTTFNRCLRCASKRVDRRDQHSATICRTSPLSLVSSCLPLRRCSISSTDRAIISCVLDQLTRLRIARLSKGRMRLSSTHSSSTTLASVSTIVRSSESANVMEVESLGSVLVVAGNCVDSFFRRFLPLESDDLFSNTVSNAALPTLSA